ncbi:hypothetical protein AMS68_004348 [Peltaster fructicola]|uniref:SET domain-containing protein n=1 Tax=Peltaster fructicola TaxID=286661 RepID=A0A6H0XVZ2_9PEZI|nr:hypothetical protein AMS68_004348 [Peltaster fructicola]
MVRPKTAKRQRVISPPAALSDVEPKHEQFTTWARDQGVEINGVLPKSLHGRGLGLVTTTRISKDDRILFIPEETMFKPDLKTLQQQNLQRISSQAKLAISALLHFTAKDVGVKLWRDTWPTVTDFESCMPMYWSREVIKNLPSSSLSSLKRQQADYMKDWNACQLAVENAGHNEHLFKYYWMIVNSRSFHWSPPKGGAGYMVMCPFIDYLNHGPTGSGCDVFQRSDGYEVIAQRAYEPGEEILISYGAHINEKLLVHYGFILPYSADKPSVDDEVRIDDQINTLLSDDVKAQLSDLGYLGPFALVPVIEDNKAHGWEACFKTQVAIRATMLTCNEWEFFAGSGDDLSGDKSVEVTAVLAKAVQPLLDLAKTHCDAVPGASPADMTIENFEAANNMIKSRWQQIKGAVESIIKQQKVAR